jgi:hypothetical protein
MIRHRWGSANRASELRTSRACTRCGLVRVTRHDGGPGAIPWTEFYRRERLDRGPVDRCDPEWVLLEERRTPACEPVEAGVTA